MSNSNPSYEQFESSDNEAAPESGFESYYDTGSGHWSLRRLPSSAPPYGVDPDAG